MSRQRCRDLAKDEVYRWQYIFSGTEHPRFRKALGDLITEVQGERINNALAMIKSRRSKARQAVSFAITTQRSRR